MKRRRQHGWVKAAATKYCDEDGRSIMQQLGERLESCACSSLPCRQYGFWEGAVPLDDVRHASVPHAQQHPQRWQALAGTVLFRP